MQTKELNKNGCHVEVTYFPNSAVETKVKINARPGSGYDIQVRLIHMNGGTHYSTKVVTFFQNGHVIGLGSRNLQFSRPVPRYIIDSTVDVAIDIWETRRRIVI